MVAIWWDFVKFLSAFPNFTDILSVLSNLPVILSTFSSFSKIKLSCQKLFSNKIPTYWSVPTSICADKNMGKLHRCTPSQSFSWAKWHVCCKSHVWTILHVQFAHASKPLNWSAITTKYHRNNWTFFQN